MSAPMSKEHRVTVSLALQRYLRAIDRFQAACNEFNDTCRSIRNVLPQGCRFIATISNQNYLVTSDREGNFEVEQIETI
jgi:hypothetical protein